MREVNEQHLEDLLRKHRQLYAQIYEIRAKIKESAYEIADAACPLEPGDLLVDDKGHTFVFFRAVPQKGNDEEHEYEMHRVIRGGDVGVKPLLFRPGVLRYVGRQGE